MYKVTTWDSDWLKKGYINSTAEMWFESECEASVYLDNWLDKNNGSGRIEYDEWKDRKQPLFEFPFKVGLPLIVNSRYHRSRRSKKFAQMLGKIKNPLSGIS